MFAVKKMEPEKAIMGLDDMMGKMNRIRASLDAECRDIEDQWEGLGRAGGQRADHAADFLSRLRPILRDLAAYCNNVERQIDGMVADPFGRNQ